ncbi:MAG TPA: PEP-CTERM sorting domain-containing protein [Chthoniobacteraceae bacterium]|jgi:hypothetical protein
MNNRSKSLALLAAAISACAAAPAFAQNANFAPGDLIMGFQALGGTGSDQTVLTVLGNSAAFRDAQTNSISLTNIGSTLTTTFGNNWFERSDLRFGIVGVWSNSSLSTALQNGDPARTLYVSRSREGLGAIGAQNSTRPAVNTDTSMSTASNNMVGLQQVLETQYTTRTAVVPTTTANTWEEFNSANSSAFGAIQGSIEQAFGTGTFGVMGAAGSVEAALDLFRIQARNNVASQYGAGAENRVGQYLGTFTIDQVGAISYLAIPEPTSIALLASAAGLLGFTRRRVKSAA